MLNFFSENYAIYEVRYNIMPQPDSTQMTTQYDAEDRICMQDN
jgi:hypothetical protein